MATVTGRAVIGGQSRTVTAAVTLPVAPTPGAITHGRDIKENPSRVGLKVATTSTVPGYVFDDAASVTRFGANLTGSGTLASPYLVDRVTFTQRVKVAYPGKHFRFTNCRFYGEPANPTQGGTYFVGNDYSGKPAHITLEDCELGPNTTLAATGGPASGGGTDKGVQSYCPVTIRRCNIWGANILVYLDIERSAPASLVEDCWLHDIWSSAGDHTDIVNGNAHASHVTVRRCFMDGVRTGNTYVTNGFGIYDDPTNSPSGIIEDWTIEDNYIDRCATGLLATTSTSRFLPPFVVNRNVFDRMSLMVASCRPPTAQAGNVRASGSALKL